MPSLPATQNAVPSFVAMPRITPSPTSEKRVVVSTVPSAAMLAATRGTSTESEPLTFSKPGPTP